MQRKLFTCRGIWPDGIFITRVLTGVMIFSHALELFSAAKMNDNFAFLKDIGFPLPVFMGYLAKITELTGAVLLAAGLFTRFITIPLMIIMIVVIAGMNQWDIFNGELTFLFLLLFLLFLLNGPGKISLDYWLFDRKK